MQTLSDTTKLGEFTPAAQSTMRFGDLQLAFTSSFEKRWDDGGSGADNDVAFYHPIPPEGYYALGSVSMSNAEDPNGKYAAICVRAGADVGGKAPLAVPLGYGYIWDDSGSGADDDGSCWRPIPPDGYVALGDVFVLGHDAPSGVQVMCVAAELVGEGKVGRQVWNDGGSGADRDFSSWQIDVSSAYYDTADGFFAANTFVGVDTHDNPGLAPVVNVLRLPLPTYMGGDSAKPTLESRATPFPTTNPTIDRVVTVPFTAIIDNDKSFEWKMQNSPFYEIRRAVCYELIIFEDNNTGADQTKRRSIVVGVTTEQSQTFSITTGIKVSYESGVEAGGFSSKVGVEISLELGYSTTTGISVLRSAQDDAELLIPAGKAAAVWLEKHSLRVYRANNEPVGQALEFKASNTAYRSAQFPPPASVEETSVRHRAISSKLSAKL
ncbi:Vps62-related protein [Pseudoduganella sp. LjRoot289]|uniref:Vps62-related protein n=1 Tax=Pseudoduganella sp. LjRoot289 TaxID=3342314 RepID=UPI003ECF2250